MLWLDLGHPFGSRTQGGSPTRWGQSFTGGSPSVKSGGTNGDPGSLSYGVNSLDSQTKCSSGAVRLPPSGARCPSVQSRYFLVQESIKGEVADKSRYTGGSFAFGDGSFPEVTAFWRRALRNFCGCPTLYPFPVSCIRVK